MINLNPKLTRFIIGIPFLIASVSGFAQSDSKTLIKTGNYDNMLDLSYDKKNGLISGILSLTNDDENVSFNCSLRFKGAVKSNSLGANTYPVDFFQPGDTSVVSRGYILIKADGIELKSDQLLTPCQNMLDLKGGNFFEFTESKPFIATGSIISDRAYIYKSSSESASTKMYLVKGDFISIVSIDGNWISFEYMNPSGKRIKGWLMLRDVAL